MLESRAGESDRHIALKILAYLLLRNETGGLPLRIEQGVGQRHKPDLVVTDDECRVRLWVDCGDISVKRLGRIAATNPGARVVIVRTTGGEAAAYARAAERFLPVGERHATVAYLGFDDDFLPAFRRALRGTNRIGLSRGESAVEVVLNGERFTTVLDALGAVPGVQNARYG